jgi:hypothetical protein
MDIRPPPTILQFAASMMSDNKADRRRSFVVSYHVDDKAFVVFEKVVPNSGFAGGKFLQKCVCNNPETGKPYEPGDIYLGATVILEGWEFLLQEASEATLKTMESRPDVFIKSDLSLIMAKLRKILNKQGPKMIVAFQKRDTRKRLRVNLLQLQEVLAEFDIIMADHEFLTLFRRYQFGDDGFEYQKFVEAMV